jgi:predicted nucleic acid-binding protein
MRVFLDTCSLQRPLDSRTQVRIILESEAVMGVLALCEAGSLDLVSSEALVFEMEQNPSGVRQEYASQALSLAKVFVMVNEGGAKRATGFTLLGIKPLDAVHLALAEEALADFFCTCDDRLLKRAKAISDLRTRVVSPTELVEEIEI